MNCGARTGCLSKKTRCSGGRRRICRRPTSSSVAPQNDLPARPRAGRAEGAREGARCGDVPGAEHREAAHYYRWLKQPVSERDWVDAHLANAALDIHADDPAFGYRFIADELADAGFTASERRVWRVCSEHAITSIIQRKRRGKTARPPVRDDLVPRTFAADEANRLWLTDITEHPTP